MSARGAAPRQARDVMAFGQETGRVLSDGRVVGRAEPFAKVFQSSRLVKRAVGLTAWGILEDIALDAGLDVEGRLVAETSTRRISANLGINRETVVRHLQRLREFGFVLHEEVRDRGSGRYETARYVLDPSACIERFTQTPPAGTPPWSDFPTTGATVVEFSDHGKSDHPHIEDVAVVEEQQQQQMPAHAAALCQLGVDAVTALALAARHSPERVSAVVRAAPRRASRNPAGWAIRALDGAWAVTDADQPPAAAAPGWQQPARGPDIDQDAEVRWRAWDLAVSAVLDDDQLARAARLACTGVPAAARVGPAVRVHVIRWAAHCFHVAGTGDLRAALQAALDTDTPPAPAKDDGTTLPRPPDVGAVGPPLRERLTGLAPTTDHPSRHEGGPP